MRSSAVRLLPFFASIQQAPNASSKGLLHAIYPLIQIGMFWTLSLDPPLLLVITLMHANCGIHTKYKNSSGTLRITLPSESAQFVTNAPRSFHFFICLSNLNALFQFMEL